MEARILERVRLENLRGNLEESRRKRNGIHTPVTDCEILGLLSSLAILVAATNPDHGSVGFLPEDEFALALRWDGDGETLVRALVAAGVLKGSGVPCVPEWDTMQKWIKSTCATFEEMPIPQPPEDREGEDDAEPESVEFQRFSFVLGLFVQWLFPGTLAPVFALETAQSVMSADAGQEPTPKKKTRQKSNYGLTMAQLEGFNRLWEVYPLGKNKALAAKAYRNLNPDETLLMEMIQAVDVQKNTIQWRRKRIIPLLSTWINARRWEDTFQEDDFCDGPEEPESDLQNGHDASIEELRELFGPDWSPDPAENNPGEEEENEEENEEDTPFG